MINNNNQTQLTTKIGICGETKRMSLNQSKLAFLAVAVLGTLGLGLGWWFFFRAPPKRSLNEQEKSNIATKALLDVDEEEEEEVEEVDEVIDQNQNTRLEDPPQISSNHPIVEDDDDDEEKEEADQAAARKIAYEDLLRFASKLQKGEKFLKAAEKFTEAIDLANQIPSASKDIVTLYNNRRFCV
jgi:type IV secretory pathway VirB10-like protein